MRRRTITLVVVGLVMALFVLPAAADELFGPEAEEVVEDEYPNLSLWYDEGSHNVFYSLVDEPEEADDPLDCTVPDGITVVVDEESGEITYEGDFDGEAYDLPDDCYVVNIEGPNGQVNHGQFVSNMVRALKADYYAADDAKEMYGPFGQWVKQFAHDKEIGKDNGDDDLEPLELEAADADDDDGPGHGKDKNKDKGKGKGKNK